MEKREFTVPSSDGIHTLSGLVYLPTGAPKGLFHAVHGMTEHIARYDRLLSDMAKAGFIAFGYDHLGHGKTAKDEGELGYIAKEKGWERLSEDVGVFSKAVRDGFGKEDLPYYLLGHSMGSFVSRLAAERFVSPQGLVLMGTGGPNPAAGAGLALVALTKRFKGEKHISPLLYRLAFGSYNKRFGGGTAEDPSPWLTRDEGVRRAYYADPFCTFKFTASAMGDLIRLIKLSNRSAWFHSIPTDLPVLLVSGEEDPVGNYGKGVKAVETKLKKAGRQVSCHLYPGARHEILNDTTYVEVKEEILRFCTPVH